MKRRLLLPLVLLALCLLVVGVASATYTDAIGFRWNTSDPSPTLTRVFANGTTASVDGDYETSTTATIADGYQTSVATGAGTVTISARAVKADGTNGAAREWAIGTTIKNTYTTGVHDQVIDNFAAAVGTWAAFDATPVWPDNTPTISSTVARYVRNGNLVTFGISYVISEGNDAASPSIPLPVAASQIANFKLSIIGFKKITSGGTSLMSDPFAYIDYTEATPVIKFSQFGTLPSGYTAELRISGSYEVAP